MPNIRNRIESASFNLFLARVNRKIETGNNIIRINRSNLSWNAVAANPSIKLDKFYSKTFG